MCKFHKRLIEILYLLLTWNNGQNLDLPLQTLFTSYVQSLWLYAGICQMYFLMNNRLNPFITVQEMNFLLISLLFSFLYLTSSITGEIANEKFWKKSEIVSTYTHYIISKFQLNPFIIVEEINFLIINSLFSFLYLSSSITGEVANEKFWKKSEIISTYTHYIISKFQFNPFTITEVIDFCEIFSSNNFAAHFLKTRSFTITNLKHHNSTSHASIYLIFFLMFLAISSTNFDRIWENQFSNLVYFLLDRITYTVHPISFETVLRRSSKKIAKNSKIFLFKVITIKCNTLVDTIF